MSSASAQLSVRTRPRAVAIVDRPHTVSVALLLALCFSGDLKATPLFEWLPVDLTLLTACLLVVALAHHFLALRFRLPPAARFLLVLWLAFIPGAVVAVSAGLESGKSLILFSLTLLIAVAPVVIMTSDHSLDRMFLGIVVSAVIVAPLLYLFPSTEVGGNVGRLNVQGATSIAIARILGAGALVSALYGLSAATSRRTVWWTVAAFLGGATVLIGSRGPFVALIVAFMSAVVSSPTFKRRRAPAVVGAAVLLGGLVAFVLQQGGTSAARLAAVITGDTGDSARGFLYRTAFEATSANPWGLGWGGFSSLTNVRLASDAVNAYPHNLLLETLAEGGWAAGAVLVVVVALVFRRAFSALPDRITVAATSLAVYTLVNAMFSSDINGNRLWWASLAVLCVVVGRQRARAG